MAKLTQVEKNKIKLANQLSASFRRAFPGLQKDPRFAPIRVSDVKKGMQSRKKGR